MVKIATILIFLIIGFSRADINWIPYNQAFEKAKKENKIVFIYIFSPSCHYCDIMDFQVFESKRIEDLLNTKFVSVKLRKCSQEGMKVRNMYGFIGTPMFYFLDKDGSKIKTIFGAWEEKDFFKILNYFATDAYKSMTMDEYFMKQK